MIPENFKQEDSISLPSKGWAVQDYLRIIIRRRWVILVVFILFTGAAAFQTFTATPIFRASVQLLIERQLPRVFQTTPISQFDPYSQEFYQTQYKLLASPALAKKVADKLQLQNHPYFRGIFRNLPPDADSALRQQAEENLVSAVQAGLSVDPVKDSRLVNLSYSHPDPKFAAEMANVYAQCFIEQALDMRFAASQETGNWLQKKVAEARKKLEESETKLIQYKKTHNIVTMEDKETITSQKLEQLNKDLVSAQTRRMEAETRYNEVSQGHTIPALTNDPLLMALRTTEAQLVGQISELSKKYGKKHPRMIQLNNELSANREKINSETRHVIQSIKNEYAMAEAQENNLKKALQSVKGETQDLSERTIQYRVLLRDVETNRAIYENILKSLKEIITVENVPATNIRIVYPAVIPTAPINPGKASTLFKGAGMGLLLGIGLALLLESLDTTLKTPEETESRMGIPNLAVIPHLDISAAASDSLPFLVAHYGGQPLAAEAYRKLRTSILFSTPGHAPQTLMVTSSLPLEGKTLTAINLATVMAKAESNILLVDADFRRPSLHSLFGVPKEPGLTNFLVGDISEIPVSPTPVPNLHLLPCGHIPPNPSELLGSESMRACLVKALKHFDQVIIDSPPLLAVTDPVVLATQVEGVLFVIRSETVPRKAALEARDQLLGVQAHILGTLINDVSLKRDGYYYHYYHRYGHYYKHDEAATNAIDMWGRIRNIIPKNKRFNNQIKS